jgi:hypothetical protein
MSKTIITVLISVGILSGCNPDRNVSYINVKNLPQVQLERVGEWPVDCQDYYLSLAHCGDYYIGTYYKDTLFFGILDAGFRTLHRIARRGRGVNEYIFRNKITTCNPSDAFRRILCLLL